MSTGCHILPKYDPAPSSLGGSVLSSTSSVTIQIRFYEFSEILHSALCLLQSVLFRFISIYCV